MKFLKEEFTMLKALKAKLKAFHNDNNGMEFLQVAIVVIIVAVLAVAVIAIGTAIKGKVTDAASQVDGITVNLD